MNKTIETILNHRSIRSFTDQLLTEEEVRLLVESAQSASTSSYIQAYSIIGVTDRTRSVSLRNWPGISHMLKKTATCLYFAQTFTGMTKWPGKRV